jgi:hypothetical protein
MRRTKTTGHIGLFDTLTLPPPFKVVRLDLGAFRSTNNVAKAFKYSKFGKKQLYKMAICQSENTIGKHGFICRPSGLNCVGGC